MIDPSYPKPHFYFQLGDSDEYVRASENGPGITNNMKNVTFFNSPEDAVRYKSRYPDEADNQDWILHEVW